MNDFETVQNALGYDGLDLVDEALPALERIQWAVELLANPFAYGEPSDEAWKHPELEIDCCVKITYADVLRARELLNE